MRILQLCSAREIGGGERHVIALSNALARQGHQMFAALSPASPLSDKLSDLPDENIVELPMRNALNVATAAKLARFVRDNQVEIVHAHVARDYTLAALIAGRGGARLILTRHVLFPLHMIHRLTLRRVSRVIAVSHAVAKRLANVFRPDQIVVIHNGIDVDHFARKDAEQKNTAARLRVGTIGHLSPIKGQEDFIRAAAIVCTKRSDVDFIIAGEDKSRNGENRRALEALITELSLNERVQLTGWIDGVAELLSTLDVFVSSARSEPFGLSIIEAMAAGVPVIATSSEGAREIIEQNISGRLVPIADATITSSAIAELLDNQKLRESFSANASRAVRERFSLERMVDATERVYRRALQ